MLQTFWKSIFLLFTDTLHDVRNRIYVEKHLVKKPKSEYGGRRKYEQKVAFNLMFPFHSSIPIELSSTFPNMSVLNVGKSAILDKYINETLYENIVEKELIKCGKTVYADITEDVDTKYEDLKKSCPHIEFFKSKETFLETRQFWIFPESFVGSKILYKVNQMFSNGIFGKLNNVFLSKRHNRRLNPIGFNSVDNATFNTGPKPLSLSDKVQSCFYFYLVLLCMCMVIILIEICYLKYTGRLCFTINTMRIICASQIRFLLLQAKNLPKQISLAQVT